ncbi:hypothetical protein V493_05575 [Pseudogymnoascus sp. VKM F-4281 (FW-2241)]|nr:hypothetical protein V493_05575 [Pseudogymnoascus sp. VKM F-4281 (FW-2241)]
MPTDPIVAQGEFHASVPPSKPTKADKHAPGTNVGNAAAPEFHASTQPSNTSPPSRTFKPNPTNTVPGQSPELSNPETWVDAESTITGATSQDVYKGMGKPVLGQTTGDLRHQTSQRSGLEGVGASAEDSIAKRGLDRDVPKGGKTKDDMPPEERATMADVGDREPENAEEVAREMP